MKVEKKSKNIGYFFILLILIIAGCSLFANNPSSNKEKKVLVSKLAGRWYSNNKYVLKDQIKSFEKIAKIKPLNNIRAIILPHAGYIYSGYCAVCGFKSLGNKKYKRIIIIGPSHYFNLENSIAIPDYTHYKTPLGEIPLDTDFIKKLRKFPFFINNPRVHKYEHSVQIEVPLVQYFQPKAKIVPMVMGNFENLDLIKKVGNILLNFIDKDTLIIISSDFIHYGPNYNYIPFTKNIMENLKKLDKQAFENIKSLDPEKFISFKKKTKATICGWYPITLILTMLDSSYTKAHLICEDNSSSVLKDNTNVVTYLSIAFTGKWRKSSPLKKVYNNKKFSLSKKEKEILLKLARNSLKFYLKYGKVPTISDLKIKKEEITDNLRKIRATFVTLNENGYLRGCIGEIFPTKPLYKSVIYNAILSGVNDPRFYPITLEELKKVRISISVLTLPYKIDSYKKIRLGIDGIVLEKHGKMAVFLPQVAVEQNWDLPTTLKHLSKKAGLNEDDWKKGAKFLVFQAIVFKEKENKHKNKGE